MLTKKISKEFRCVLKNSFDILVSCPFFLQTHFPKELSEDPLGRMTGEKKEPLATFSHIDILWGLLVGTNSETCNMDHDEKELQGHFLLPF